MCVNRTRISETKIVIKPTGNPKDFSKTRSIDFQGHLLSSSGLFHVKMIHYQANSCISSSESRIYADALPEAFAEAFAEAELEALAFAEALALALAFALALALAEAEASA